MLRTADDRSATAMPTPAGDSQAMTDCSPISNHMVEYLNSLRTQEKRSNPSYVYESRAAFLAQLRAKEPTFPSDEELRVATRLDGLVTAIADRKVTANLIFLTGDAGDGK